MTTGSSRARSPGEFLRRIHQLLLGEDGFYDEIFTSLRIPYEPVRWLTDREFSHEGQIDKAARVIELINAYRANGHLMADTDPLEFKIRTHPDLDIARHGLTLWDLEREFPVGGFAGEKLMKLRDILGVLRDAYCRRVSVEYMYITDLEERRVAAEPHRDQERHAGQGGAEAHPRPAERGRGVRDVPADQVRRAEAIQPRRAPRRSSRCSTRCCARPSPRTWTRSSSAWPTAAGSTCWPTSSASRWPRSSTSSRATWTRARPRAPAT